MFELLLILVVFFIIYMLKKINMFELLLMFAMFFIIYVLLNNNKNNNENDNNNNDNLINFNEIEIEDSEQNIRIGDVSNHINIKYDTDNNNAPNDNTNSFLDNLNEFEADNANNSSSEYDLDLGDSGLGDADIGDLILPVDTGYIPPINEKSIIDIDKIEQEETKHITNIRQLLNGLDVPKILGDAIIGDIAEKTAKSAMKQSIKILAHMQQYVKNPKILREITNNIDKNLKIQKDMIKKVSSTYRGKAGKFIGSLNKRVKGVIYNNLINHTMKKMPFRGPGASPMSKIGLSSNMKMIGSAAKSLKRIKLGKFIKMGVSSLDFIGTLMDLIDPFGFENMQSNKQFYRIKRKLDMEHARIIYDEYNDIEREKKIKGINQDEYIPLNLPIYWGPLHEMYSNEALEPTVENTKEQINREKIVNSYSDNLLQIIDREFSKFLEHDANWSEIANKLNNMKEHLICAEVEDYNDAEREEQLHKYFTDFGLVANDDMWEQYKEYIPKYECKVVPPNITGTRSATDYARALVEQDLIPYEVAFLYLQIFITFMEKIAIPGAYRMVCEEFPTKWVKNTLSKKDLQQLRSYGIDDKWNTLNILEQTMALLGNMKNDNNEALYNNNHHYIKSLLKLYNRQIMSMEVASDDDCTLNYFNDQSYNITNDDLNNIKNAIDISTEYFNTKYNDKENVEEWLGSFGSMKINPSIIKDNMDLYSKYNSHGILGVAGSFGLFGVAGVAGSLGLFGEDAKRETNDINSTIINYIPHANDMILGKNKCEPNEYCRSTNASSIPVIGNMADLIEGNNSCKLKKPSFTFNFEPEQFVESSCNINCYTEWTDWEFIRLLNKYRPDIEEYMEKNNIIYNIDDYINIVKDCSAIVQNNDMCDPNSQTDVKEQCDKTDNSCLDDNGKFKLTETKKMQLINLGKIIIDNNYFNTEFNRLYDILIYGRDNSNSKRFGKCPLNYCKQNMDRDERDDEIKRIMHSCMYRHKDSCILNWSDASADYRAPYYSWNHNNNTCYVNQNIWQYRTLCDCATKKGNGLFGRIKNDEANIEDPKAMIIGAAIGAAINARSGPTGAVKGAAVGAAAMSGNETSIGSMALSLKNDIVCGDDPAMQAYTCDDLTNLNGDDYNDIDGAILAGKPGAVNSSNDAFKFGKNGYTAMDRDKILMRLSEQLENEEDHVKKQKILTKIELMKNPNTDTARHDAKQKFQGQFNKLLQCKCNIQLQPQTDDWSFDTKIHKKQICEGNLGVDLRMIPKRGVQWNDETHDTYPNACVTNKDFCDETGGCWFHNKNLNPPNGLDDCEIPAEQNLSESIFGTTYTRSVKRAIEQIPGVKKASCLKI